VDISAIVDLFIKRKAHDGVTNQIKELQYGIVMNIFWWKCSLILSLSQIDAASPEYHLKEKVNVVSNLRMVHVV